MKRITETLRRVGRYFVARPKLMAIGVIVLVSSATLAAQAVIKLTDGTFAQKVVVYSLAGVEQDLLSTLQGVLDVNVAQVNGTVPLDAYASGTLQNGATATGNGSTLTVNGYSGAQFTVNCSVACTGGTTITLEGTEDGTNYVTLKKAQRVGASDIGGVIVNQGTTPTVWYVPVAGFQSVRARISAYSAGTITVTGRAILGGGTDMPTAVSTSYTASAASTNATSVKATPGAVTGYSLTNTTTTIYYLRMYNLATAPTCSSSTGFVETIAVPPASSAGLAGGRERHHTAAQDFTTGIGFCLTGGASSTDNTNAATGVQITILYR